VVGGVVGAVVMGALMTMTDMRGVLEMAIPAMYTVEGPALALGFALHVVHGAILGLGFLATTRFVDVDSVPQCVLAGVVYGVVVWLVAAALIMPLWLSAVGFAGAPSLPNVDPTSLLGHVVYGGVLGAVFPFASNL